MTADWLLEVHMKLAWRSELKRWRLRALDKFEPNERTHIVTPWAPVGVKKVNMDKYGPIPKTLFSYSLAPSCSWIAGAIVLCLIVSMYLPGPFTMLIYVNVSVGPGIDQYFRIHQKSLIVLARQNKLYERINSMAIIESEMISHPQHAACLV